VTHLVSTATFDGSQVRAEVRPENIPPAHPLSTLAGSDKGVVFSGRSIGRVVVTGGCSHPRGAAAAAFGDMLGAIEDRNL
jgi:homoserine dehydrogenase